MTREAEPGRTVVRENVVQHLLRSEILGGVGLLRDAIPELIVLGKPGLEVPRREHVVDVGLVAAVVARVFRDALSEFLLDGGQEGILGRQRETAECVICRLEASAQWGDVVALRQRYLLRLDVRQPKRIRLESLLDTRFRQMCVRPGHRSVTFQESPIAVPGWRTKVRLGSVVIPFSVTTHEEYLVLDILGRIVIEGRDECGKPLPLCQ